MFLYIRLRNLWSFLYYGYSLGKINFVAICINLIILIYSLANYHDIIDKGIWMFLFLIFVNVIWQFKSIISDVMSLFLYPDYNFDNHYHVDRVEISDDLKLIYDQPCIDSSNNINTIYSERINTYLQGKDDIMLSEIKGKVNMMTDYISQNKDTLLLFLKTKWHQSSRASFFNEQKLCMKSEIHGNTGLPCTVKVCKGNYYNSFVTNEIFCKRLYHNDRAAFIYPPLNSISYKITELSRNSFFSDHIGVSTMVITTDGYMIILSHNNRTVVHPNTYQPTCSGSADYVDWKNMKKRNIFSLRTFIETAVKRELYEETSIEESMIDRIEIIGFFRDLIRGGKPDFCTISHISMSFDEAADIFHPDKKEVNNKFIKIKVRDKEIYDSMAFTRFIEKNKGSISPSLYMSYKFFCTLATQ